MARIDALYLEDPCSGSRRMVDYLAREGIPISRDRARNLMRCMGLRAIYRKPRTTVPGDPAERFPCLVDVNTVTSVDQIWATDITYIPLQKGFLSRVNPLGRFATTKLAGEGPQDAAGDILGAATRKVIHPASRSQVRTGFS